MKKKTKSPTLSARLAKLERTVWHLGIKVMRLERPSITTTVTSPVSHKTHAGFYIDVPDAPPARPIHLRRD